jgi:hypothetical protein
MISNGYANAGAVLFLLTAIITFGVLPMAGRTTWRIPIHLVVDFHTGEKACSGVVTNISEKGVFIRTSDLRCVSGPDFDITIPVDNGKLHIPGRLVRSMRNDGEIDGIGVELVNPPKDYLEFVENLLYQM